MAGTAGDETQTHQAPTLSHHGKASESHISADETQSRQQPGPSEEETKKWGTHIMGAPAAPGVHPDNKKAALWNADEHQQIIHQPYVQYTPVDKPSNNPFEPVIHLFNSWSTKAETIARNIWHNRRIRICV